eukprot:1086412-Amphidinium_carterae.2
MAGAAGAAAKTAHWLGADSATAAAGTEIAVAAPYQGAYRASGWIALAAVAAAHSRLALSADSTDFAEPLRALQ